MLLMTSYTGVLSGGPNDGDVVSSSVKRIPVEITTRMWLDGNSLDKDISIVETKGTYIWGILNNEFKWNLESVRFSKQKIEEV